MADLNLAVVIESILDAKGFEEFKARLSEAGVKATAATGQTQALGRGMDLLGQKIPHQQFRLMASEVLLASGAFGGAGRTVGAFSHVLTALSLNLGPAVIAVSALASGAGLVANTMAQKREAMEKARAEADKLTHANDELVQRLRDMRVAGTTLEPVLRDLISAHEDLDRIQARQTLITQTQTLFALRQNAQALKDQIAIQQGHLDVDKESTEVTEARRKKIGELSGDLLGLQAREKALTADVAAQSEAMRRGARSVDELAEADRRRRDFAKSILEQQQKQTEEFMRASAFGTQAEREEGEHFRRELDRDKERASLFAQEMTRQEKLRSTELERNADVEADTADVEFAKRAHVKQTFNDTAQLLAAAFPKQKGFAIAAATINTFEGATTVLRDPTLPFFLKFAAAAAIIAYGLVQVQQIRQQEAGFDLPESDLLARRRGFKWADDLLRNIDSGFNARLGRSVTPGGSVVQNITRQTTINRGPVYSGGVTVKGIYGASKTDLLKTLQRELIGAQRLEDRTSLS